MSVYDVECRCGFHSESHATLTAAEVQADVHETRARRPYQHDARIVARRIA